MFIFCTRSTPTHHTSAMKIIGAILLLSTLQGNLTWAKEQNLRSVSRNRNDATTLLQRPDDQFRSSSVSHDVPRSILLSASYLQVAVKPEDHGADRQLNDNNVWSAECEEKRECEQDKSAWTLHCNRIWVCLPHYHEDNKRCTPIASCEADLEYSYCATEYKCI